MKKKKLTLGEFHTKRIICFTVILIMEIFQMITVQLTMDNKPWVKIISTVLSVIAVLFLIWFMAISGNVDKEDELAKENMFKAHNGISKTFTALFFVGILFILIFRGETFTIKFNTETILNLWFSIYICYLILESGLFLHYEGKVSDTEEE